MSSHFTSTILLPSVDPPGTDSTADLPFIPLREERTDEDTTHALHSEPFARLPRSLIPDPAASLQPPVLHYGWYAPLELLLRHADERGLNCMTVSQRESMGISEEDWVEEYDEDDEAEDEFVPDINVARTANNAIRDIAREEQCHFYNGILQITIPLQKPVKHIVSLYTNYDLRHAPSEEDIKKLQKRLGIEGEPRWFFNHTQWTWNWAGRYW